jgi:nitrogen fixation NifU-like protein
MDRQTALDLILDHYEHPRRWGPVEHPTFTGEGVNPGCGDVVRVYVRLDGRGCIADIGFEGEGCTISRAAASVLVEQAAGQPLAAALALDEEALAEALGGELVRQRLPCVSLGLRALREGARRAGLDGG